MLLLFELQEGSLVATLQSIMNMKPRKLLELKLHTYLVLYKVLIQFMKIGLGSILAQETLIIVAND
jgi:hypothetical protein